MPTCYHTKIGERFGTRVITGFLRERDSDGHIRCVWKCDCGAEGTAGLKSLRHTANCTRCRNQYQKGRPTHGEAGGTSADCNAGRTHLYQVWANMKQRTNPHSAGKRNRKWYGDRGITVCDEWKSFEGFRSWAKAHGYREGLSLDRIQAKGNYKPSNCQWLTRLEHSRKTLREQRAAATELHYDPQRDTTPIEMLWGVT
jgi:hypothetical protein